MNPYPLSLVPEDVGRRVVVRRELPGGGATDVLGELLGTDAEGLLVRRADGAEVRIELASVRAAKRVPPGPVRIRPARPADATAIEALRVGCWRTAYRGMIADAYLDAMPGGLPERAAEWELRLREPEPGFRQLVADASGAVVGWGAAGPSRDADRSSAGGGEIFACYVAPQWSGVGLGGRLLRRLLRELAADGRTEVGLWVLPANEPARRFYASYGLTPDGAQQTLDLGGPVTVIRCLRR